MARANLLSHKQIGKFISWPQIWGSSWPFAELRRRFVFLPQLMAICRRRATKHFFLMTQALATCCWRLAGQNTCSFADLYTFQIHTANTWLRSCGHDVICPCCVCVLGVGNRRTNPTEKFSIQTGLGLRYTTRKQMSALFSRKWPLVMLSCSRETQWPPHASCNHFSTPYGTEDKSLMTGIRVSSSRYQRKELCLNVATGVALHYYPLLVRS